MSSSPSDRTRCGKHIIYVMREGTSDHQDHTSTTGSVDCTVIGHLTALDLKLEIDLT